MSSFKALTALAFLSLATTAFACDGVWVPNTAGNWSTGFSPCEPMTAGDTGTLGTPPSGPVAVNLDVSPTLTTLKFQNGNPYTISGSNTLTLQGVTSGDPSFINVIQGNHAIVSGVNLNNNTTLTVTPSAGASLDLFGAMTDGSMSFLNLAGSGAVNIINTSLSMPAGVNINGAMTINGCDFTQDNEVPLNTGFGLTVITGSDITLNSGSYTVLNSADLHNTSMTNCIGSFILCGGTLTVNGGVMSLANTGSLITDPGAPSTVGAVVVCTEININGGTLNVGSGNSEKEATSLVTFSSVTVNGGTLINNGFTTTESMSMPPAPCVIVNPQGTIAGTGLFASGNGSPALPTTVVNGGTAIPGIPDPIPGIMNILGTYQQTSTGTLLSNISNINSYGQISSTNATIAGALDLYGISGIKVKPGNAFKVLTTTNGVSGTFSSVKMLNTPYIPMVFYFPNYVEVVLNAGTYPALYQSVFASINHKNIRLEREMQNLHKRFAQNQAVPREVSRNETFSSKQGPILATVNVGSIQTERRQERLHREMETCNNSPWNVYFGPIGSVGEVHRKGFNAGFGEWSAGALAGFDYAFEEVGVGLLAEYERLHGSVHRNWGQFNIDQVNASLYSTYVPQSVPELAINGIIGGGYEGSHTRRNTGMTGKSVAQGNQNGWEFDGLFGLEYAVTSKQVQEFSDNFRFTPMVNLQYVYVHFPKYKEHGAGIFDLSVSHFNAQSLRSTLGAWFNYLWQWTDLSINLEADVGWQREYFDRGSSINFTGVSSSTLRTRGAGRNTCLAGLDLLFTLYKTYGIEASYDFEWNKMFHDHSFYLGFNIEF
jgi:uncharacterized protein YhjY with autotransporter beta-barrel domain